MNEDIVVRIWARVDGRFSGNEGLNAAVHIQHCYGTAQPQATKSDTPNDRVKLKAVDCADIDSSSAMTAAPVPT
jgi:hypothetical protein